MRKGQIAAAMWLCLGTCGAHAADGSISRVRLDPRADAIAFSVEGSAPISADRVQVVVTGKRRVLVVRVNGFTTTRTWLKLRDRGFSRVLLHPAKDPPEGAILRVRMRRRIPKAVESGVRVSSLGGNLLVEVPRNPKIAQAWVAAPLPVPAAEEVDAEAPEEVVADEVDPVEEPPAEEPVAEEPVEEPAAEEPVEEPAPEGIVLEPIIESPLEPEELVPPMEPPPPVTDDALGGMSGLAKRIRGRLGATREVPRVAVLPFDDADNWLRTAAMGAMSAELLSKRLELQPQLLQVEREDLLEVVGGALDGRNTLSPEEARAVGLLLGADTLVLGSVSGTEQTIDVRVRMLDAASGQELGQLEQPFTHHALFGLRAEASTEQSKVGAAWRSAALPGWGQVYNQDHGRAAGYLTFFVASLVGAATSTALGVVAEDAYNDSAESAVKERDAANAHYERTNVFLVALGAVWVASIVDAYVSGEDLTTVDLSAYGGDR